ncbi:glycogen synthase [Auriculariales sp. MPI-PUGE-AT-0066]|nr:glycogen synthase [Auriculariales sp. MPI-PUGE-AT-0066]
MSRDVRNPKLFECAWEVANRVGGVYSVLRTKVPVTVKEYGDNYVLLGPLTWKTKGEVEQLDLSDCPDEALRGTISSMRDRGVHLNYGRWLVDGSPQVVVFDLGSQYHRVAEWRADLYNASSIPTPEDDGETNDATVFGHMVSWFLGEYASRNQTNALIAQFHEWQVGVAVPLIRKRVPSIGLVFTTHATLLGRYLCAGSVDFYNNLQYFDVDAEAGKRGIYHRYCIERAATHSAHVFTTVSDITALEAEQLLKRKPDFVTPNGLNVKQFAALHEFQNLHSQSKEKIHEFVRGHFYGHYDFDLDNTLYFFTAGRYEFRNKGIDIFIESLARLNHRLQSSNSKMTVVAFIIMPAQNKSYSVESLKGHAVTKQLRDSISLRVFEKAARFKGENSHDLPDFTLDDFLTPEDRVLLKRRIFALKRASLPAVTTHNMADDDTDPCLDQIRRCRLFNHEWDRVKVIFHPEFLSSNNPVLGLDYDEFVRGCHLGVFPSYYEPWGYTPAECAVLGVPSITTNLTGFGCFVQDLLEQPEDEGCYIVDRRYQGIDDSVEELTRYMFGFCGKTRRQRINLRNRVERLAPLLDWKNLGGEYVKARTLALRLTYPGAIDEEEEETNGRSHSLSISIPGTPGGFHRSGAMTPGGFGTLIEEMQALETSDYHGDSSRALWKRFEDEESYPVPLILKVRSRAGSIRSGRQTPG